MKLPKFLANSYLSDEDEYEFTCDVSDAYRTKYDPDPQIDDVTINFKCYNTNIVEIKDVFANKTCTFAKNTSEMYDHVEDDVIDYTFGRYQWGKYFEFDDDKRKYTEIEPFKYFNDFAEKYVDSDKNEFFYLTVGFEDLAWLIPECAEDRATNLETIEDVTEFMHSLGYERLGA